MSDVTAYSTQGNGDFATYIAQERERLSAARDDIQSQLEDLQKGLDRIASEFRAIEAYEAQKLGKSVKALGTARAPRGSRKGQILELVQGHPDGLTRREILEDLSVRGDKNAEMAVSNALTSLIKSGQLSRNDKRYVHSNA
jgi:hypothetical protein